MMGTLCRNCDALLTVPTYKVGYWFVCADCYTNDCYNTVNDPVNHPSHYTSGKVECIEGLEAAMSTAEFRGFLRGNAIKYLWRAGKKDDIVQDLKKAQWYLNRLVEALEGGT